MALQLARSGHMDFIAYVTNVQCIAQGRKKSFTNF